MNGETLLKGAIFCTRGEFSSAQGFYQLIRPYFKDLEFNKAKVLRRIDELIKELTQDISEIGKKEALNLLISKDLIKVKNTLENLKFNPNLEVEINEHFRLFIEICSKLGIDLSYLQLRIVDNFPSPYEKMDFWAMSYDVYDYEEFGIPIGVMIKKTHLAPWYSSSLLAHEIVHGCFAKVRLPYLARGLEDGLCDFFGSLFLCANIFGYETCQNILLNSRLSFPQSQLWFMYTESLRQVCLLYKVYGLQGILDLLRKGQSKGREIIKTIEAYCIRGLYEKNTKFK